MLSFITGGNYCSRVVSASFPRIVSRFEGAGGVQGIFWRQPGVFLVYLGGSGMSVGGWGLSGGMYEGYLENI